jgi:hypothetical protein
MMLAKNDKLIIIAGVIVLVVAAVGIALYTSPSPDEDGNSVPPGMKTYSVEWETETSSLQTISEFADKNTPYEESILFSKGNLKSITFNLSWIDDKAPLGGSFGLDTLTLEITTPDGTVHEESATSARRTTEGNVEITLSNINTQPSSAPIEAEDLSDAQAILQEAPYYKDKWVKKDFTVKVSVQIGEIRILKRLRDQGNDFTLEITYEYFDATLIEESNPENNPSSNDDENVPQDYVPSSYSMIGAGLFF